MATPSTRKVTETTFVPVGTLGVAVSTTMRFTMAAVGVTVMEAVVGVVVVVPVPVVVVPVPVVVVPVPVVVVPVPVVVVPVPVVVVVVVPVPVVVAVVTVPVVLAMAVAAGVVVPLVPPQPATTADNAVMTDRTMALEQFCLKVSYIADSPCKAIGPASLEYLRRRIAFRQTNRMCTPASGK